MCAYLQLTGTWWTIHEAHSADDTNTWDSDNEKVMGIITLCYSLPIRTQVADLTKAKEIWDLLMEFYGQLLVGSAHTELKNLLTMTIPTNQHPTPILQSCATNFAYLKEAGFKILLPVQLMILVAKLPSCMKVVA